MSIEQQLIEQRDSLLYACNVAISFFETDARSDAQEQVAYDMLRDAVAKVNAARYEATA